MAFHRLSIGNINYIGSMDWHNICVVVGERKPRSNYHWSLFMLDHYLYDVGDCKWL